LKTQQGVTVLHCPKLYARQVTLGLCLQLLICNAVLGVTLSVKYQNVTAPYAYGCGNSS
jgi:hypothetical protein